MSNSNNINQVRSRQKLLLIGGIGGALVLGTAAAYFTSLPSSNPQESGNRKAPVPRQISAPGENVNPQDAWRGKADQDLQGVKDEMDRLKAELAAEKAKASAAQAGQASPIRGLTQLPGQPVQAEAHEPTNAQLDAAKAEEQRKQEELRRNPPPARQTANSNGLPGPLRGDQVARGNYAQDGRMPTGTPDRMLAVGPGPAPQAPAPIRTISTFRMDGGATGSPTTPPAPKDGKDGKDGAAKVTVNRVDRYMPAGAFARAVLLSGLDAPTGGQAQANAQPVLLRITDFATLPNRYRQNIKDCFVTGQGYGDVSSERAEIRTESFSCVLKNGTVVETELKGYLSGEDGKYGMRGRLVTKQGQVIANALLAGIASGIGSAFVATNTTQSVSGAGVVTSVEPGKAFGNGVGTGVSKGMDLLAQYYIKTAEKMYPVIEVDAGRMGDVIILKGVDFEKLLGASNLEASGQQTSSDDGGLSAIAQRNRAGVRNQ